MQKRVSLVVQSSQELIRHAIFDAGRDRTWSKRPFARWGAAGGLLACMLARLQSRGRIRRLAALAASLDEPQTQFGHKLVKLLITYVAGSRLPTGEDSRDVEGTLPAARRGDDIADEAHFSTGRGGGCGGQNFVEKIFVCVLCVLELG